MTTEDDGRGLASEDREPGPIAATRIVRCIVAGPDDASESGQTMAVLPGGILNVCRGSRLG